MMRVREDALGPLIDVENNFIIWKRRQHHVTTRGKFRDTFRDGAAKSNQLIRFAAVSVISGNLEPSLKQPLRDWPAHVSHSYKSDLIFFRCDWIHTPYSFRRRLNEFLAACSRLLVHVIYKLNLVGSLLVSLSCHGVSCRRRHEFGADWTSYRLPQNLIDRRERICLELPIESAGHCLQFFRMPRAPQRRGDSGLVQHPTH